MTGPIHTLAFHLTYKCDARCTHCALWVGREDFQEVEDFAPFYRAIEEAARLSPGAVLALTGGEPFLSAELFPLIRHAKRFPYKKVVVTTNGFSIGADRVAELCETGLDELIVSLDGFPATHNAFRGVPGAYALVDRILDATIRRARRPEIVALVTISAANLPELRDFVSHLNDDPRIARIAFQVITQPMPADPDERWYIGHPLWPTDVRAATAALEWLIQEKARGGKIHNTVSQLMAMKRYFQTPERVIWKRCNVGTRYLLLLPHGGVRNCMSMGDIGNVRSASLTAILSSAETAQRLEEMTRCRRNCHFLVNCGFVEGELL